MGTKLTARTAYGSLNRAIARKDLHYIVKNTGTFASPVYAAGSGLKITSDDLKAELNTVLSVKKSLTSADILTLNSVPIIGVAAPGAGFMLDIISAFWTFTFLTTPYAGANFWVDLILDTATVKLMRSDVDPVSSVATRSRKFHWIAGDIPEMIANKAIMIKAPNDFTAGNGTMDIYIEYKIIEL